MTRDKVMMEEAVKQLEPLPQGGPKPRSGDGHLHAQRGRPPGHRGIRPEDRPDNTDHVLLYNDAQKKIADFSDSALATVRTNDTGEVGEMLVKLVNEIKGFGDSARRSRGWGLFWNAKRP